MLAGRYRLLQIALGLVIGLLTWSLVLATDSGRLPWGGERQKSKDKKEKPRAEEEEDDPKDKKQKKDKPAPKRGEDEEGPPRKINPGVIHYDDDKDKKEKPGPKLPAATGGDLSGAARENKHPDAQPLFAGLVIPYDLVSLKRFGGVTVEGAKTGGMFRVEPLPVYVKEPRELTTALNLQIIDKLGSRLKEQRATAGIILAIRYYEQIAIEEVNKFLDLRLAEFESSNPRYLGRYDQLIVAEQALSAVLRYHQSAREREVRKGDAWDVVETELRNRLLAVQLAQLDPLAELKAWDASLALVKKLAESYTRPNERAKIAKVLPDLLRQALKDPSFTQAKLKEMRHHLRVLEEHFPGSDISRPINENLRQQAQGFTTRQRRWRRRTRRRRRWSGSNRPRRSTQTFPGCERSGCGWTPTTRS